MHRWFQGCLVAGMITCGLAATGRAERYVVEQEGKRHVVHSRRAPVLLHRAVPPFQRVHIYQGRDGEPRAGELKLRGD
jgi:hypothetical protein